MKIGCHISIAGGIVNAPQRAADLGCEVFQIFTRSPQGGPAPKLTEEVVQEFKKEMEKHGQANCYIHAPYYINFASVKEATRKSSVRIVREELERGSLIGAKYVMFHPGSSTSLTASSAGKIGEKEILKITASGVAKVLDGYNGTTELLLEISAGAGEVIGDTFDELAQILKLIKSQKLYDTMIYHKIGICLDSAHMFASGYDVKTKDGFRKTMETIKKTVGLDKIKLIHANDSKIELGGRKDRHDHIGHGKIGENGFVNLMSAFPNIDLICETHHDLVEKDIAKLKKIRDN